MFCAVQSSRHLPHVAVEYSRQAGVMKTLVFKYYLMLITLNLNYNSQTWLVATA